MSKLLRFQIRCLTLRLTCFSSLLGIFSTPAIALPDLSLSSSYTTADPSRSTYMDIGGVWDGSSEVTSSTGDTFSFSVSNSASATDAFNIDVDVTLTAGFNFVPGSESISFTGAGCPGTPPTISATQTGSNIDFTFSPAGFDLPADCQMDIDYGLTADATVAGGTYNMIPQIDYEDSDGSGFVGALTVEQRTLVQQGSLTLTATPGVQEHSVGDTAPFTFSACNTGFGGLFDVVLDESAIAPGAALSITSMAQVTPLPPGVPAATGSSPILTIPYLAPGDCFDVDVEATVTDCQDIENTGVTHHRVDSTPIDFLATVNLDLTTPLITYTHTPLTVPGIGTNSYSFNVNNTGLGDAINVVLDTSLEAYPVIVNVLSTDWTYNAGTGEFTYTGASIGVAGETLDFEVSKQQTCPPIDAQGGFASWGSAYTDTCGNIFAVPSSIQDINILGTPEPIEISKNGPPVRLNIGASSNWNINVSPVDISTLMSDPVVITDTLPTGVDTLTVGAPPAGSVSCGGPCGPGSTLVWTIPASAITTTH